MIEKPIRVIHVHKEGQNREIHDIIDLWHSSDKILIEMEYGHCFQLTQQDIQEMYLTKKRKFEQWKEAKQNGSIQAGSY